MLLIGKSVFKGLIYMNIEDVKRDTSPERRNIRINMRITKSQERFVQENNLSFTKIFDSALKQLGYKEPTIHDLKNESDSVLKDSYRKNKIVRYRSSNISKRSIKKRR